MLPCGSVLEYAYPIHIFLLLGNKACMRNGVALSKKILRKAFLTASSHMPRQSLAPRKAFFICPDDVRYSSRYQLFAKVCIMKYLAVDFGEKRTGIAVSDQGGVMAFARATVRKTTKDAFWTEMLGIVDAEQAEAIVVGMPRTRDGQDTMIIRQIRNFIQSLKRRTPLPVYVMEETLSSFEAEEKLRAAKKNRAGLDAAAAAGILESFLNLPESKRTQA